MERALKHYPIAEVSGHFHDTYGQAIGNVYASLEVGISTFDASVAGLGGCPYAKGATGNVATEDVLFLLDGLGIDTGISLDGLVDAAAFISALGRKRFAVANALLRSDADRGAVAGGQPAPAAGRPCNIRGDPDDTFPPTPDPVFLSLTSSSRAGRRPAAVGGLRFDRCVLSSMPRRCSPTSPVSLPVTTVTPAHVVGACRCHPAVALAALY